MLNFMFWSMIAVSLTTGVLVLFLLALRPVLGRVVSPRFLTALWALLALRLLLPFAVPLPESAVLLRFDPPSQIILPASIPVQPEAQTPLTGEMANNAGQTLETDSSPQILPSSGEGISDPEDTQSGLQGDALQTPNTPEQKNIAQRLFFALTSLSPAVLLLIIWVVGTAVRLLFELIASMRLRRNLFRSCSRELSPALQEQLDTAAAELRLKKLPAAYLCSLLPGPMLLGFFHPVLLLPAADCYNREDWACMLRHELVHYRCHHMLYKLLFLLLCCLQWWNPAAYLLRRQAYQDLELSCDSLVLSGKTSSYRAQYSRALLNSAAPGHHPGDSCSSCFHHSGVKIMKRRLLNILGKSGRRGSPAALAVILVFCLLASGFVGPSSVSDKLLMDEPDDTPAAQAHPAKIHEISTAEELVAFAQGVNSGKLNSNSGDWWVLTDDIDLSGIDWQPIGKVVSPLNSSPYRYYYFDPGNYVNLYNIYYDLPLLYFDGQGHYVTNLTCSVTDAYGGFFFSVASGSIIRNLNVSGSVTAPSGGGLIGYGNGLIENCSFSGSVQGYMSIGGLAGYGSSDLIVRRSISAANVSGSFGVGGFAASGGTFIDCCSTGTVSGISTTQQQQLTGLPPEADIGISNIGGFISREFVSLENCISDAAMFCYDDSSFFGSFIGYSTQPLGDSCYYNRDRNQHWSFGTIQLSTKDGELSYDEGAEFVTIREDTPGWSPQGLSSKETLQKLDEIFALQTSYTCDPLEEATAIYYPRNLIPAEGDLESLYRRNYLDWFADTGLLECNFSEDDLSALGPTEERASLANPLFAAFSKTQLLEFILESPSQETRGKEGWLRQDYLDDIMVSFLPCDAQMLHTIFSDCYDPQRNCYYYVAKEPSQQTLVRVKGYQWEVEGEELLLDYELYRVPVNAETTWQNPALIGSGQVDLKFDEQGYWKFLSNRYTPISI